MLHASVAAVITLVVTAACYLGFVAQRRVDRLDESKREK